MTGSQDDEATSVMDNNQHGSDGALDRVLRLGQKPRTIPAIFIHAGAGFHSYQNEHVHLKACVAAAEMGMRFLKAGAAATEGVEAALRILEDKEITNAGYGSNLSIDGIVECDATIVDHLGRSGACGAVPNVRNPISLAKLILDESNKPLTLRRVPPNALVGEGARSFAEEHGMATLGNEHLISKNARDRFLRWQDDLDRAESKGLRKSASPSQADDSCQSDLAETQHKSPRGHAAAVMAGTWNEGQPDTPFGATPTSESPKTPENSIPGYFRPPGPSNTPGRSSARVTPDRTPLGPTSASGPKPGLTYAARAKKRPEETIVGSDKGETRSMNGHDGGRVSHRDGSASPRERTVGDEQNLVQTASEDTVHRGIKRPFSPGGVGNPYHIEAKKQSFPSRVGDEDLVTDTIGAIAIDEKGRIAAGSSSGGIGMKHRGRLGPAALVGVGTAVVPLDEADEDRVTVAAVTSGTGEHMATTMASQRCAERIYRGTRRGPPGGMDVQDDDDDAIMESFITDDFMNHPGVKNCHSAGAIGVMVVKKARTGYYLYFAHNTDSFAIASMGGLEKEPCCTMSRLSEGAKISKGGRKVRLD